GRAVAGVLADPELRIDAELDAAIAGVAVCLAGAAGRVARALEHGGVLADADVAAVRAAVEVAALEPAAGVGCRVADLEQRVAAVLGAGARLAGGRRGVERQAGHADAVA